MARVLVVVAALLALACSGGGDLSAAAAPPASSPAPSVSAVPAAPSVDPVAAPPVPTAPAEVAVAAIAPAPPPPLDPSACAPVEWDEELDEPHRFLFDLPPAARASLRAAIAAEMGSDDESRECVVRTATLGLVSITCASNEDYIRVYTAGLTYVPVGDGFERVRLTSEGRDGESLFAVARARFEAAERDRGAAEEEIRETAEYAFGGGTLAIGREGLLFFSDGTDPLVVVPWSELTPHLRDGSAIARWGAACGVAPSE